VATRTSISAGDPFPVRGLGGPFAVLLSISALGSRKGFRETGRSGGDLVKAGLGAGDEAPLRNGLLRGIGGGRLRLRLGGGDCLSVDAISNGVRE
jgi:hypothetical protein